MNRIKAQKWLSCALDGELSASRRRRLDAWLAEHPDMVALREDWTKLGVRMRNERPVSGQTPEAAWQDVRRAIRMPGQPVAMPSDQKAWRLGWAAACAAVLFVVSAAWWGIQAPSPAPVARADRTTVEWVETDLPGAMSMVFEDETTGLTVIWVLVQENGEDTGDVG